MEPQVLLLYQVIVLEQQEQEQQLIGPTPNVPLIHFLLQILVG